jgi:hypothetical protein
MKIFQRILAGILFLPIYVPLFIIEVTIWLIKLLIVLVSLIFTDVIIKEYIYRLSLATDDSLNAFMAGDYRETISSRAGRAFPNTWWCRLIDLIVWWQPDHCEKSVDPYAGKEDLIDPDNSKLI